MHKLWFPAQQPIFPPGLNLLPEIFDNQWSPQPASLSRPDLVLHLIQLLNRILYWLELFFSTHLSVILSLPGIPATGSIHWFGSGAFWSIGYWYLNSKLRDLLPQSWFVSHSSHWPVRLSFFHVSQLSSPKIWLQQSRYTAVVAKNKEFAFLSWIFLQSKKY